MRLKLLREEHWVAMTLYVGSNGYCFGKGAQCPMVPCIPNGKFENNVACRMMPVVHIFPAEVLLA